MSKGKLVVISGASGVGKGTVLGIMMKKRDDLAFSVSATTRPPRPGEVDGESYYFITKTRFEEMIARNEFLEYDAHAANYYGTPRSFVEKTLKTQSVILEIDVVGALNVKKEFPEKVYEDGTFGDVKVVIMQGRLGADLTRIIQLNGSSQWLLEQLAEREFEVADVVALLTSRYDVDEQTATADVQKWVEQLREHKMITE